MRSQWLVICRADTGGRFIKKLERVLRRPLLEVRSSRATARDGQQEWLEFYVEHDATAWREVVFDLLETARRVTPGWQVTLIDLDGAFSGLCEGGSLGHQKTPPGFLQISWTLRRNQQYGRLV